jgi:hypothetical protein
MLMNRTSRHFGGTLRTGYSLPVGQADAVTRRISGYIAVNVAEVTR